MSHTSVLIAGGKHGVKNLGMPLGECRARVQNGSYKPTDVKCKKVKSVTESDIENLLPLLTLMSYRGHALFLKHTR